MHMKIYLNNIDYELLNIVKTSFIDNIIDTPIQQLKGYVTWYNRK